MKTLIPVFFIFVFSLTARAQTEQLLVKSSSKGSYVEHKVAPKENFYSIGRLFNVHPRHIASFNSLDMSKGLHLGQTIKIPLSDTNYSHKSDKGTPVYYVTGSIETIYNVSTNNDVLMDRLRKWNQITADKLPSGTKLIVGYLTSNEVMAPVVNNTEPTPTVEASKKANADSTNKEITKSASVNKQDVKKDERKNDVVSKAQPKEEINTSAVNNPDKDESKQAKGVIIKNDGAEVKNETSNLSEGFFKSSFTQQVKQQPVTNEQTVTSGIFKTSSGWGDAKYYLLMNGAEPGTIVRVINPANNKIIYAKLLGDMTDMKQNQGLNIRMSNAAAAALDISETDKFIVKLDY